VEQEDRHIKKVIKEVMNIRNREVFLQKKIKQGVTMTKNIEQTDDVEIEFVKACPQNIALPEPCLA
jgi:outer membrane protein assembly factor BamA